jgi:hypothetical protein
LESAAAKHRRHDTPEALLLFAVDRRLQGACNGEHLDIPESELDGFLKARGWSPAVVRIIRREEVTA